MSLGMARCFPLRGMRLVYSLICFNNFNVIKIRAFTYEPNFAITMI